MRTFDPKEGDISFYLILFERQARIVHIKEEDLVTNLVGLLPLEMANLIAREPEEKANDYEHIKGMLLKRFKLNPEAFRVKFKRHCKSAENICRDFGFELANYFNEWISGLKIYDFDKLKQLVIVEQMKEHVSRDIQQHFIDDWSIIVTVDDLTEKLDDYENARQYNQATKATLSQPYRNSYREKPSMCNRKCHTFGEGYRQELNNRSGYDKRNSFQKSVTCFNCRRVGHLARFCRDKKDGRGKTEGKVAEVKVSEVIKQLGIPEMRKKKILEIAHESVFGAHLGAHKTFQRIKFSIYWPGMVKEIKAYCSSCHGCQLRKVIRLVDKIPITPVSRPELPFQVVNVDLIGPVDPVSSQGHKYLLCLMDQHSRWPEAIPLKSLTAKKKLEVATHKAKLTGDVQQGSYAKYYNRQKKHREFAPEDQVLVLIPDSTNNLYDRWTGPVKVVKRVKPNSYYLPQMAGGNLRLLHVNKIQNTERVQTVGVIYDIDDEFGDIYETPTVPAAEKYDEALDRVTLDYLSKKQQTQLKDLLHRHRTLFSGKIKRAKVGEHVIKLKNEEGDDETQNL
ncbi:retrovirus-related Pol polyprotein from transposon opus [Trichonephila clavipes]|nr:retrovirus-related Pol polyprotein from transposon opus [Trichonephila clavipes]